MIWDYQTWGEAALSSASWRLVDLQTSEEE